MLNKINITNANRYAGTSIEVTMKNLYILFVMLSSSLFASNILAQTTSTTLPLNKLNKGIKTMSKLRFLTILFLFTFLLGSNANAQWVSTGLGNGTVNIVFANGANLFAGLSNGALISTDNGINWNYTSISAAFSVWSFAVNGTDIFAGTTGGLFRSTDNGLTWNAVNSGMPLVQSFAVIGTTFFAGTEGGGVYFTTDNGTNWTQVNTGLTNLQVRALISSGTNLFAGTLDGVFLSTDNGLNWTQLNTGLSNLDVRGFAVLGTNIFAGTNGGIFRSDINTINWASIAGGLVRGLAVTCGTDIYAGGWYNGGGVIRSTDNGTNWTAFNTGLTTTTVPTLTVKGSDLFAGTWNGGVFRSPTNCTAIDSTGSICGIKFNDLDGDSVQDPNEPVLPNWEINLSFMQASGFVNLTDTTDANGNYCFDNLQPGFYRVWETQQPLWQQTSPVYPGVYGVILASGEHRDSVNFGNRLSPVGGICDSLNATASKITSGDCIWSLSLHHPATVTGISSIQILALSPNQFTTGTGLGTNYQTWFTSGTNTYTPPTGIVPGGTLNNFFTMSLSYVTSPQIIVVNWLNDLGSVVCSDTLLLDCEISCTTIISDTVTCVGNNYNFAYTFTNNATYSVSNIVYTLQSPPSVTIAPLTAILSPQVAPGSNSTLQNIQISGAVPGDTVRILARYNSPDGCCWCYDTLKVIMPICGSVCDSVSVQAQGSSTDCCYDISLTNNSNIVFSNIEFELLSGGMYSTYATTSVPGWAFTNIFPNNLINLVKFPITQGIGQGIFNNVLDLCIRQYTSPNQVIEVRWIKDGQVICRDTLRFECDSLYNPIDTCSQVINDTLICLSNGTVQYNFQVQNNSNINATGYGIHPTTPGVIFSDTLFNISIMPGQVSPMNSIIISGIGQGQNLCYYTAIFNTVVPGDSLYNWCCHSDTMCITTPNCGGQVGCVEPPSEMVAWWPLDETSGTTSLDLAGFNNAGTQVNGPVPVAGKVLGGLQFDGINDYIEVPDNSELNFGTGNFSIDAWVKVQANDSLGQLTIVNKIQFPLNRGYSLYLSNGEVRLILSASSYMFYISSVHVADGNWHHIAVTVDRTDPSGIKFYKNGIMLSSSDPTTNPGTITAISPLRIGTLSFTVGDMFKGSLDEIEMFNRVLTNAEIVSIFAADSSGKCKPLTDVRESEQIPKKFELMQSYPNPFNPTTTIRYDIPKTSLVKICVYDILGREIKVLMNEEKNPGRYEVIFDARDLASGIYYYTIRTGDFAQSKKMILLK